MYKFYQLLNDTAVFAYKLMGVPVLLVLMLWTLSYLSLTVFYLVSNRWIVPVIVGPTNERVLREGSLYNNYLQTFNKLKANKTELFNTLYKNQRCTVSDATEFNIALNSFVVENERAASDDRFLADPPTSQRSVRNSKFEAIDKFKRRLIDVTQLERELYQITRQERQLSSVGGTQNGNSLKKLIQTYNQTNDRDLLIQEMAQRSLGLAQARIVRDLMELNNKIKNSTQQEKLVTESLNEIEKELAVLTPLIAKLKQSPFLSVHDNGVPMAFVPYQNKSNLKLNARVYSCSFYFFGCKEIGTAAEILSEDEVTSIHPFFSTSIRGNMVKLSVKENTSLEKTVLMIGRPPLGF